jgi:hypothetical protein
MKSNNTTRKIEKPGMAEEIAPNVPENPPRGRSSTVRHKQPANVVGYEMFPRANLRVLEYYLKLARTQHLTLWLMIDTCWVIVSRFGRIRHQVDNAWIQSDQGFMHEIQLPIPMVIGSRRKRATSEEVCIEPAESEIVAIPSNATPIQSREHSVVNSGTSPETLACN